MVKMKKKEKNHNKFNTVNEKYLEFKKDIRLLRWDLTSLVEYTRANRVLDV